MVQFSSTNIEPRADTGSADSKIGLKSFFDMTVLA